MTRACRLRPWRLLLACLALTAAVPGLGAERLVFGSFENRANADNWAARLAVLLNVPVDVLLGTTGSGTTYRVVSAPLDDATAERVRRLADSRRLRYWRLLPTGGESQPDALAGTPHAESTPVPGPDRTAEPTGSAEAAVTVTAPLRAPSPQAPRSPEPPVRPMETRSGRLNAPAVQLLDVDIGAQARSFFRDGLAGQAAFQPSFSVQVDYYRAWDEERQTLTVTPFFRYDVEDGERTHFDLREAVWSLVGDDWDLHVGVKQVFWGVTEFKHLVDIVNQTDLVEDIDGEEKLGQPMVHLSLVRSWGILDLHLLTGFRERTFPGVDGRPRFFIPIDADAARYESGAGRNRVDAAVRWSQHFGALDLGVYHFSGTSRDPLFEPRLDGEGGPVLEPFYPVIDQTGIEALAIQGDWAFKLEAIHRTGFPDRYYAFNAGFERTLVGAFGTRADLGLVVEYLYDDRGDDAFDTFFENDLAVGTRWHLNDVGDSQALLGVIWDHETDETVLTLEASRRLGETWTLLLQGRAFAGAAPLDLDDPFAPGNKGASVARDDYIELELKRYF
jgi:hypothetical protein